MKYEDFKIGVQFKDRKTGVVYTIIAIDKNNKSVQLNDNTQGKLNYPFGMLTIINSIYFHHWDLLTNSIGSSPNNSNPQRIAANPIPVPISFPNFKESDICLGMQFKYGITNTIFTVSGFRRDSCSILDRVDIVWDFNDPLNGHAWETRSDIVSWVNSGAWIVTLNPVPVSLIYQRAGNSVTINGQFVGVDMAYVDSPKKCTCSSKDIFNYGCRCGAFHEGDK